MSESESIAPTTSHDSAPLSDADDLVQRIDSRAVPEREGLPRNYRMRADAHYVEQLGSPAQPVIRLLATAHIECRDLPPAVEVAALTKSIATHGVLQPLIVRRQGSRYGLIAGRKRLAAAIAAKVGAVPCLLHDAEGAAAAAIADAANLRLDGASCGEMEPPALRAQLHALSSDLATIQTSLSLMKGQRQGGLSQQVGADLLEAQAFRAAWLVSCMRGAFEDNRMVPVGAIIQRVADGFAAHVRLMGLQLDCAVTAGASVWKLPEDSAAAMITGAVFATLACLDDAVKPAVEVNAEAQHGRTLKIEVIQRDVRVPARLGSDIAIEDLARPEELIPVVALRVARNLTATYGGTAEFEPLPSVGSVLRITFVNPQPTA